LCRGAGLLGLDAPDEAVFRAEIAATAAAAALPCLRLRYSLFRRGSGGYLPEADCRTERDCRAAPIEACPGLYPPPPPRGLRVGICPHLRLAPDALSACKSLSALRYVQAARYAAERRWDEILLLNSRGRIAEAGAANLFWWDQRERLCCPPLSEGGVAGIFRRRLLETASRRGIPCRIQPCRPDDLGTAREVWLTNALRGIRHLGSIDGIGSFEGCERAAEYLNWINGNTPAEWESAK